LVERNEAENLANPTHEVKRLRGPNNGLGGRSRFEPPSKVFWCKLSEKPTPSKKDALQDTGGDTMHRTQAEQKLDAELAEAMRGRLDKLAELIIERHDNTYRNSSMSTLPHEERLNWIMLEISNLIDSIEDGVPHARANAYFPSATAFDQTSVTIVSSIVNAFDSAREAEEVVMEFLIDDYEDNPLLLFALMTRLRIHSAEWTKQGIAKSNDFLLQLEEAQRRTIWREIKEQFVSFMHNSLIPILTSIRMKTAQARNLLKQGNDTEALVLLSEMKLLSGLAILQ
jgi:hypothetical protein